ncbi:MAG: HEAT repeat domain-containing protein [Chloroflexota bacterium]
MQTFEQLITNLSSDNKNIRSQAILALGKSGDARAIVPLVEILINQDEVEIGEDATFALVQFGDDALPHLLKLLTHDSGYARFAALHALGKLGNASVANEVIGLLDDDDSDVQYKAITILRQLKARDTLPAVLPYLADEDINIRDAAFWTVFELARDDLSPLLAGLQSEDARLREGCVMMLGVISKSSALNPLSALINDSDVEVRLTLAQAFDDIGGKRAVAYIEQMTNDTQPKVQAVARGILKRLEKEHTYKR